MYYLHVIETGQVLSAPSARRSMQYPGTHYTRNNICVHSIHTNHVFRKEITDMISSVSHAAAIYKAISTNAVQASHAPGNGASAEKSHICATDTVEISQSGSRLLDNTALFLPTPENVRKKTAELEAMMATIFRENGIANDPPVELSMNSEGTITVTGEHPDADRIAEALNADEGLTRLFHTVEAISSHARSMQEHIRFQEEYRASGGSPAVVAKYSHLFAHQTPQEITMRYGGSGIDLLFDGTVWEV